MRYVHESDLRWFLDGSREAALGQKSNHASFVARLEGSTGSDPEAVTAAEERQVEAVRRERKRVGRERPNGRVVYYSSCEVFVDGVSIGRLVADGTPERSEVERARVKSAIDWTAEHHARNVAAIPLESEAGAPSVHAPSAYVPPTVEETVSEFLKRPAAPPSVVWTPEGRYARAKDGTVTLTPWRELTEEDMP